MNTIESNLDTFPEQSTTRKKSGFRPIPQDELFLPKPHDRRLKFNRPESGDLARSPAIVAALEPTNSGQGSTSDIRHIEHYDEVSSLHHVICYSLPQAMEGRLYV